MYLGFTRDPVPLLFTDDYPFRIGRAVRVREGADATIVANRDLVAAVICLANTEGGEVYVGVEQCTTYLFKGLRHVDLGDLAFAFQYLKRPLQSVT